MSAPVLELRHVTRIHGEGPTQVRALYDLSLTVAPGELVAVMGPSGSGKSTLLSLAGALDAPTDGTVVIEGQVLDDLTHAQLAAVRRRHVGYVFQDFNLLPALTAAENVALPLELDGSRPRRARRMAVEALREVGLQAEADRFPEQLSGGQRQRVAIARGLVGERRLILADEPTGALDSTTGEAVLQVLRARCDAGAAALLVTHDARLAGWADRVVFLKDGVVVDATQGPLSADSLLGARV
ncbi:ABC transporter ATP-binding protein [Ornithinimicrobium tianjinense]|uniref:Macrolide ABC transporter ATP-binding protein n=1 Tax=Ornithinimicrobium tianjinense TaxID=1195761 RepID=A0A917BJ47_9MICO|nr:ABC transporter ATP-binding protein [Ornithinimicrobium tianjinense]GGF44293.1 macrolide ABC transporter ATP-binding protein [Ornithinimicrobium tianjinense]